MLAHVRGQHHVDHHLPHARPLLAGQVAEDVALRQLQQLEGHGQVVVLQHGLVVVHDGELGAGGDEVLVGGARMVYIMHATSKEGSQHL